MNISQKFFHVGELPDSQSPCILYYIPELVKLILNSTQVKTSLGSSSSRYLAT